MPRTTDQELYRKRMKQRLKEMFGAGRNNGGGAALDHENSMQWAQFVQSGAASLYPNLQDAKDAFNKKYHGGGMRLKYGRSPSEKDVDNFIRKTGGNPFAGGGGANGGGNRQSITPNAQQNGQRPGRRGDLQSMVQNLSPSDLMLLDAQYQQEQAKKANLDRYDEVKGMRQALLERNMGRVKNFGAAAKADLEERAAESMGAQRANLAARGLGSTTIGEAFKQRNDRDLAREQQRLSEMVDDRSARYDQSMTGDLAAFIERRNDTGPDFGQMMQMMQMLGRSGNGFGFGDQQNGQQSGPQVIRRELNGQRQQGGGGMLRPGMPTAFGPLQRASFNMFGRQPIQTQLPMALHGWQKLAPIGSNRYPERRKRKKKENKPSKIKVTKETNLGATTAYDDLDWYV